MFKSMRMLNTRNGNVLFSEESKFMCLILYTDVYYVGKIQFNQNHNTKKNNYQINKHFRRLNDDLN